MKKTLKLFLFSFLFIQFFSCKKNKDYLEMIPADSDFVIQINTKQLAEKGNLKNIEQYQTINTALNTINQSYPTLKTLIEQIQKSPADAGVDLVAPVYIFGKKHKNKIITSLIMNMSDKDDFEKNLKTIYKATYNQEISFKEENNFTFIEGNRKPFIAWNKNQFIFIAGEYGTITTAIDSYFNEICKNEKPLIKNLSFAEFVKNSEDINLWYTENFTNYFFKDNKTDIDLSNSSWSNFLSFNNDNISFVQQFNPDAKAKIFFSKNPIWKKKINTDFYKYVPAKSYLNFSFAVYPKNINTILNENNSLTDQLNEYNINIETLKNSLEGEVLFSIFELDKAQNFNVNNYFSKKESYKSYEIIPQFVLIANMKNENFFNELIASFGKNIKNKGPFYTLSLGNNRTLYVAYKQKLVYITNNYTQVNNFVENKVEKVNFLKTAYASEAKHPLFFNVNLNLDEYSDDTKNYIYSQIPLGESPLVQNFLNQFTDVKFNVSNEFHKKGVINLKHQNGNALETILKFLDQTYFLYTNPQLEQHATN